ncbi:MAG: aspartate 1-decarboxylase [Deltaproteobacteria bacterium]|nr:aspartate 1-decarboxylase [Deltaproteobacteria bacterium]
MQRTMLKSKIHKATVTDVHLHYQGSMSIDPLLAREAHILPFEKINIYNITNGERFSTYAIYGEEGSGEIHVNGAAAWKAHKGDLVIVATYANYEQKELHDYAPKLVYVDNNNHIINTASHIDSPIMPLDERIKNLAPRG